MSNIGKPIELIIAGCMDDNEELGRGDCGPRVHSVVDINGDGSDLAQKVNHLREGKANTFAFLVGVECNAIARVKSFSQKLFEALATNVFGLSGRDGEDQLRMEAALIFEEVTNESKKEVDIEDDEKEQESQAAGVDLSGGKIAGMVSIYTV